MHMLVNSGNIPIFVLYNLLNIIFLILKPCSVHILYNLLHINVYHLVVSNFSIGTKTQPSLRDAYFSDMDFINHILLLIL